MTRYPPEKGVQIMHPKSIAVVLAVLIAGGASTTPSRHLRAAAQTSAPVATARLVISTAATPRTVSPGAAIQFTITVTNDSELSASDVTVCDQLPAAIVSVPRPGGLRLYAGTACRTIGELPANSELHLRLLAKVGAHARRGAATSRALVLWSARLASASVTFTIGRPAPRCPAV
jgi:uncharacterized repeat protein (TIGR01451 family)